MHDTLKWTSGSENSTARIAWDFAFAKNPDTEIMKWGGLRVLDSSHVIEPIEVAK